MMKTLSLTKLAKRLLFFCLITGTALTAAAHPATDSLPDFAGTGMTVMPVKFTRFSVNRDQQKKIILNWGVDDLVELSHFVIEKSFNGATFRTIDTVTAA